MVLLTLLLQEFEYKALLALATSGLFDSNSIVQAPKPIEYDARTHTLIMADLGPHQRLSEVFEKSLDGSNDSTKVATALALASEIGKALGDFLGRYHNWTALPDQTGLRAYCSQNAVGINVCLPLRLSSMVRSFERFGVKEPWVDDFVAREQRDAALGGSVLAMGDCWIGMHPGIEGLPMLINY